MNSLVTSSYYCDAFHLRIGRSYGPGARFSKVPKTFRAQKVICISPTRLFCKTGLFKRCKEIKSNITAKIRALRRLPFEDTKSLIMSPEILPKSFGTFEKRTPGITKVQYTRSERFGTLLIFYLFWLIIHQTRYYSWSVAIIFNKNKVTHMHKSPVPSGLHGWKSFKKKNCGAASVGDR